MSSRFLTQLCLGIISFLTTFAAFSQPVRGFAVLVGVQSTTVISPALPGQLGPRTYNNFATRGVSTAVAAVREQLLDGGFQPANITSLTTTEQTTHAHIVQTLRSVCSGPNGAKSGDLVVFYFTGHGDQFVDDPNNRDEADGLDEGLVTFDKPLLDDTIKKIWLTITPGVRMFMLVDACHSGPGILAFYDNERLFPVTRHRTVRAHQRIITRSNNRDRVDDQRDTLPLNYQPLSPKALPTGSVSMQFGGLKLASLDCMNITRLFPESSSQLIYVGACSDNDTVPSGTTGGLFTDELLRALRRSRPEDFTYQTWLEAIITCSKQMSYAELGTVTDSFRTNFPFQIN